MPYGAKATYGKLVAGVVLPGGYGIEGVYSDSARTNAFDYNTAITENTEVYVKFEQLTNVDVNIANLLAGGVTYTSAAGATSTLNSNVGAGAAYGAGSIDLTNGIVATFDDNCVKFNNVKPNNTAISWDLDWSNVDGGAVNYETYITLGGPSAAYRNLAVTVKAGCTIKVYCAATAVGRTATIGTVAEACAANATANGTTILSAATATADGAGFVLEATVTEAGTYYVNCSAAVSFFRIVVEY